jgi:hypothetical protein
MAKKAAKATKTPTLLDSMFSASRRKRSGGKKLAVKRSHAYRAVKPKSVE